MEKGGICPHKGICNEEKGDLFAWNTSQLAWKTSLPLNISQGANTRIIARGTINTSPNSTWVGGEELAHKD